MANPRNVDWKAEEKEFHMMMTMVMAEMILKDDSAGNSAKDGSDDDVTTVKVAVKVLMVEVVMIIVTMTVSIEMTTPHLIMTII